jgi:F-type H+-transporting ATPase subunit b
MTIDWWTLGFQAVNVAILIWILAKFFWRPISAMIEQRREAAGRILAEAEAKRGEAAAAVAEAGKARAGFAAEREAILAVARTTAEQESATRRAEADRRAGEIEMAARAAMATEREAAERAFAGQAAQLAVEIAARLAGRLDEASVRAAFLDGLVAAIRALPDEKRSDAAAGGALQIVSASPLPRDEQAATQRRIAEAFGGSVEIGFAVDAALVAGFELRGPHLIVANNWRADLDRLKTEIADAR